MLPSSRMDIEKIQRNYEGEENIENELVKEITKNSLAEKTGSEAFPPSKMSPLLNEEQKDPGNKDDETSTAKHPLSEIANQDLIETNSLENEPLSKRLKLTVANNTKVSERKSNIIMYEGSVDGTSEPRAGEVSPNAHHTNEAFISNSLCMQHDFMPEGDTQEMRVESEHLQEGPTLLSECTLSFTDVETSISWTASSAEDILKCEACEGTFPTQPDLEKHLHESHLEKSKGHVPLHSTSRPEHSPSLQTHVKQTAEQLQYFCDLCGFQSFEEGLLQTHFLGKTHLRRQNLVARGGFVKILTKKTHHKKQHHTAREKNIRTKSALNKPKIRNPVSQCLKKSSNKMKNMKASCQVVVRMVPSKTGSTETPEDITTKEVVFCNVDANGSVQVQTLDVAGSSGCSLLVTEPPEGDQVTMGNLNTTEMFDRLQQKRNFLSRSTTFRQSGSFKLNQRIKRRYNLLGIGKRNKPGSILKQSIKTELSQSHLSLVKPEDDVNLVCKAASEIQMANSVGTNACSPIILEAENSAEKAIDLPKTLHPYEHCEHTVPNTEGLPLNDAGAYAEKFYCQICSYSCTARNDLELHCQKNSHHVGDIRINCPQCSFLAPNDESLWKHLHDEHGVSHHCVTCHLYFLTEEEVVAHNKTERHIGLSQVNDTTQLGSDLAQQAPSCIAVESSVFPEAKEVTIQQEIPSPSVVYPANESKEYVLNKSQFQCKKCFYKTRSSSVLMRHIKLRHAQEYHFLCKACNLYSLSKEGMEKHIKRSKHLENARKNNVGLRFEECIERVCVGASDGKKVTEVSIYGSAKTAPENIHVPFCTLENKELFPSDEMIKSNELALSTVQKRGRPKGTISRTCPHCGLLASSVTNLSVHIRRKHSHQYSYLCKVCNYYTVTKGDMERHCATKKHKSRLEASGENNIEIIACPEGANGEPNSQKRNSQVGVSSESVDYDSQLEKAVLESEGNSQDSAVQMPPENVIQVSKLNTNKHSSEVKQHMIAEPGNISQDRDYLSQARLGGENDNKCAHCNFVAHSFTSLDVHVKRKHTKEFEYYCMACDYYAVTRREMIRHAATEKHKIKRQTYTPSSSGEETGVPDIAKESAVVHQEEQKPTEDCQVREGKTNHKDSVGEKVLENQETWKLKKSSNYVVSEESGTSEIPDEDDVFNAVGVETEDADVQGRGNAADGESIQEGAVDTFGEMITLKATIDCVLRESINDQETVKSDFHFIAETGNTDLAFNEGSLSLNLAQNKYSLGIDTEKEHHSPVISIEEVKTEEAQSSVLSDSRTTFVERTIENMHDLQQQKNMKETSAPEEEETLLDAQNAAEVSLNNVWGSARLVVEDVQEGNEALDAFTTDDSRVKEGTAVQHFGQFDSSIVKLLKSHEDVCEQIECAADGQNLSGLKVCERAVKSDTSHGSGKKKKSERHPLGESTRIRCDDCGFLADGLSGLNVHIAMKHPSKEKHFHCLLCGKSFYTESNLHQHLGSVGHMRNEQASVEELPEGGATFKCVKCTEPFDSEQNLFLHIKEQHEELLREVNKYIVEDTEQINREREENKGNICKYCGKMCRSSNSMAFLAHIRTHTGMSYQTMQPVLCKEKLN